MLRSDNGNMVDEGCLLSLQSIAMLPHCKARETEREREREGEPDRPFKFFFYCRKPVAWSWVSHMMRS